MLNPELRKKDLYKQGYRFAGSHSAIKPCLWLKKSLNNQGACYKNKFYGIQSERCIQSSLDIDYCNLSCVWCWRDINFKTKSQKKWDSPKEILNNLTKEHIKLIQGYGGNENVSKEKFSNANQPKHFALSLSGDACNYPRLPELLKQQPTQLYLTLPSYDEESFNKLCKPRSKELWKNILSSLKLLPKFKRNTLRLTLVKNLNLKHPEKYAKLVKNLNIKFIELKAAMCVGYATERIDYKQMPLHPEIKAFAEQLAKLINYKIIDESKESRVCLLMKRDSKDRKIQF